MAQPGSSDEDNVKKLNTTPALEALLQVLKNTDIGQFNRDDICLTLSGLLNLTRQDNNFVSLDDFKPVVVKLVESLEIVPLSNLDLNRIVFIHCGLITLESLKAVESHITRTCQSVIENLRNALLSDAKIINALTPKEIGLTFWSLGWKLKVHPLENDNTRQFNNLLKAISKTVTKLSPWVLHNIFFGLTYIFKSCKDIVYQPDFNLAFTTLLNSLKHADTSKFNLAKIGIIFSGLGTLLQFYPDLSDIDYLKNLLEALQKADVSKPKPEDISMTFKGLRLLYNENRSIRKLPEFKLAFTKLLETLENDGISKLDPKAINDILSGVGAFATFYPDITNRADFTNLLKALTEDKIHNFPYGEIVGIHWALNRLREACGKLKDDDSFKSAFTLVDQKYEEEAPDAGQLIPSVSERYNPTMPICAQTVSADFPPPTGSAEPV